MVLISYTIIPLYVLHYTIIIGKITKPNTIILYESHSENNKAVHVIQRVLNNQIITILYIESPWFNSKTCSVVIFIAEKPIPHQYQTLLEKQQLLLECSYNILKNNTAITNLKYMLPVPWHLQGILFCLGWKTIWRNH